MHYVHKHQRGFITGRSILMNVVDIEDHAMRVALHGTAGATVLFDFAAAFPSLSHDYLLEALELMGLPRAARNLVQALHHRQHCSQTQPR